MEYITVTSETFDTYREKVKDGTYVFVVTTVYKQTTFKAKHLDYIGKNKDNTFWILVGKRKVTVLPGYLFLVETTHGE